MQFELTHVEYERPNYRTLCISGWWVFWNAILYAGLGFGIKTTFLLMPEDVILSLRL